MPFAFTTPTALIPGRFQPFHRGHLALAISALRTYEQVCFAIRVMPKDHANPLSARDVERSIRWAMNIEAEINEDHYCVVMIPNLSAVVYGREVGYEMTRLILPDYVERVSGTAIRAGSPVGKLP